MRLGEIKSYSLNMRICDVSLRSVDNLYYTHSGSCAPLNLPAMSNCPFTNSRLFCTFSAWGATHCM